MKISEVRAELKALYKKCDNCIFVDVCDLSLDVAAALAPLNESIQNRLKLSFNDAPAEYEITEEEARMVASVISACNSRFRIIL